MLPVNPVPTVNMRSTQLSLWYAQFVISIFIMYTFLQEVAGLFCQFSKIHIAHQSSLIGPSGQVTWTDGLKVGKEKGQTLIQR